MHFLEFQMDCKNISAFFFKIKKMKKWKKNKQGNRGKSLLSLSLIYLALANPFRISALGASTINFVTMEKEVRRVGMEMEMGMGAPFT